MGAYRSIWYSDLHMAKFPVGLKVCSPVDLLSPKRSAGHRCRHRVPIAIASHSTMTGTIPESVLTVAINHRPRKGD